MVIFDSSNTIGGVTPGARNVISGNDISGVSFNCNCATGNRVQGNYVGTDASGTASLGNSFDGVAVGGANNAILSNAIFSNGGASTTNLGIDLLGNDGVTPNDEDDPDTGPNNLQNFPVITSAKAMRKTTIKGTLNSTPDTAFTVQLFINSGPDPSGYGEGQRLLGQRTVTTDTDGNASFSLRSRRVGGYVTATATNDATDDTSEFSAARKVKKIRR